MIWTVVILGIFLAWMVALVVAVKAFIDLFKKPL